MAERAGKRVKLGGEINWGGHFGNRKCVCTHAIMPSGCGTQSGSGGARMSFAVLKEPAPHAPPYCAREIPNRQRLAAEVGGSVSMSIHHQLTAASPALWPWADDQSWARPPSPRPPNMAGFNPPSSPSLLPFPYLYLHHNNTPPSHLASFQHLTSQSISLLSPASDSYINSLYTPSVGLTAVFLFKLTFKQPPHPYHTHEHHVILK